MYKTRFRTWGVKKYGVDSTTKFFNRQIRRLHAQGPEPRPLLPGRPVSPVELPHRLEEFQHAIQPGTSATEGANLPLNLPCMASSSVYLDVPSSPNDSSYQNTAISSVNHTPNRSQETSRPSSSDRASLLTPDSSRSGEGQYLPQLGPPESDAALAMNQNLFGRGSDVEVCAPRPRRASQIPRSVQSCWMQSVRGDDNTLSGHIVDQVVGFSSPSTFSIPSPNKSFLDRMRTPLDDSMYLSDAFRQKLNDMQSAEDDTDLVSPEPETWTSLCYYINFLLVQEQKSAAGHAMHRAAMIYQRLVRQKNDQLLSILNLVLANLFLYGKEVLAAELLRQAQKAASMYLHENDPIMISIDFMICMALKKVRTCDIKILKLRQVACDMKMIWGNDHRYCVTADYHLAWRLAMESDLRLEALSILRQTQARAEEVFDPLHMQIVALITTRARVLHHLGDHLEAEKTMSEAMQRIKSWSIAEDHPYYVEARRRHRVFLNELVQIRSR